MRWLAVLVLLAGCDYVLGLKEHFDAQPLADGFKVDDCPPGFDSIGGPTRYRITGVKGSFATSSAACRAQDDKHVHLAVVEGDVEVRQLDKYLDTHVDAIEVALWIGLVQDPGASSVDTNWHWVTGAPLAADFWSPNEPDDGDLPPVEDEAEQRAYFDRSLGGSFVDVPEAFEMFAVCECDGVAASL